MAIRTLVALVLVSAFVASAASADPPPRVTISATEELRRHLDQVLVAAFSPSFRALEPSGRREAIRRIGDPLFNWQEMARRALGPQWRELRVAERRAFADGFAAVGARAYTASIDQLVMRRLPPDSVRYLGESVNGRETLVRTALVYPRDLPLDFLMSRRGGRWEIWDVRVDGVSAAENYGAQFRRVIADTSLVGLVDRMSAKAAAPAEETVLALARR